MTLVPFGLFQQVSSLAKAEANCGPLLEIMESGSLKCLNTKSKKSWVIPLALTVFEQGARITPFIRPWSTTTTKELKPFDKGRSVVRSTESCLTGRVAVDAMGVSGGVVM